MASRILVVFLLAVVQARAAAVKGTIILNEMGGPPVANVQIIDSAHTGGPWASGSDGGFSLEYPKRQPGDKVRLVVNKEGYVVVNDVQLDLALPADPDANPLQIIICKEAEREEMARRFYRLKSNEAIETTYQQKLKALEEEHSTDATALAKLQQERDQFKAAAEKASGELAKNQPDQDTKLDRQAKRLFLDGKVDEAIKQQAAALPADNPVKPLVETATASGAYDRAETLVSVAREQIRAVSLIEEGQLDLAIAALDDATRHLGDISKDSLVDDHLALGYIYKSYAQVFSAKGDQARTDDYLNKALAIFESIAHGVLPGGETAVQFANTIHGIGNIHQERMEYRQAIDDYKIATTILPTYAYAWYDMFLCYADLAKRGEVDLPAMRQALAKTKETGEGLPGLDASHIAQLENILARFERENGRGRRPSPQ